MLDTGTNVDNMWAKYFKEVSGAEVISSETGFICYQDQPESDSLFIMHVFVEPHWRKSERATENFDLVRELAKKLGRKRLTGYVLEDNKTYVRSIKAQLDQGFRISAVGAGTVYTYLNLGEV